MSDFILIRQKSMLVPPDCQEIFLSAPDQANSLRFVSAEEDFRRRLREAAKSAPRKKIYGEDVSEGGLSKILTGRVQNPRLFTVKAIADSLGTTVGALLGETGSVVTNADRTKLREFIMWLDEKVGGGAAELTLVQSKQSAVHIEPKNGDFVFDVSPEQFKIKDFDYPQRFHYWTKGEPIETRMAAGLRGIPGGRIVDDEGRLLNPRDISGPREVFDRLQQIVKVEGRSMETRYFHGDLVRIDTTLRQPENGQVVAVYSDALGGGIIGIIKREDDRVVLKKKNPAFPAVTLPPTGWMLIGTVVELVKRNENYIEEV
jgi:hypothetical protein